MTLNILIQSTNDEIFRHEEECKTLTSGINRLNHTKLEHLDAIKKLEVKITNNQNQLEQFKTQLTKKQEHLGYVENNIIIKTNLKSEKETLIAAKRAMLLQPEFSKLTSYLLLIYICNFIFTKGVIARRSLDNIGTETSNKEQVNDAVAKPSNTDETNIKENKENNDIHLSS